MKKIVTGALALVLAVSCLMAGNALAFGVHAAPEKLVLGINAINITGAEGHSLIITPAYGKALSTASNGFSWWRSATFEWNDEEDAYVVRSVNLIPTAKITMSPKTGLCWR